MIYPMSLFSLPGNKSIPDTRLYQLDIIYSNPMFNAPKAKYNNISIIILLSFILNKQNEINNKIYYQPNNANSRNNTTKKC